MAAGFNYQCEVGKLPLGPTPLEAPKAPVYLCGDFYLFIYFLFHLILHY